MMNQLFGLQGKTALVTGGHSAELARAIKCAASRTIFYDSSACSTDERAAMGKGN